MNAVAFFEIQSSDPEKAIAFYEEIFGWKFFKEEFLTMDYWQIANEGINGGLLRRPAAVPPPQSSANAFVCSIQVEDFDATASKILELGGSVALEKFPIPGKCWQGYFIDPDQNTFGLFEVDETLAR